MSRHPGRFDGLTVDQFKARFAGTFDLDDQDAMNLALDGEAMFVTVVKLKSATITETQTGDIRRTNSLGIQQVAVVRKQSDREELADKFGIDMPLQLPLDVSSTVVEEPTQAELQAEVGRMIVVPDTAISVGGATKNDSVLSSFLSEP